MIRQEIKNSVQKAVKKLYGKEISAVVERPAEPSFGDYTTNAAMILKKNPAEIMAEIKPALERSETIKGIEVKNGFINFFLSEGYLQGQIKEILKQREKFGSSAAGQGEKVNIEFISANPTGPLTLGNGRGGFCGDVLANLLVKAGYKTKREYYVNDVGEQIKKLGHSVIGGKEAVYQGAYIEELRKKLKGDEPEKIGQRAVKIILKEMIKPSVERMGVKFDNWFCESALYEKKEVAEILKELKKKNLAYEKEGALWFKSTDFGDDKDRVLVKADGQTTYLASDAAYLKNKFKRGFEKLIFLWGADHHGYAARIKAAVKAMGYKEEQVDIVIMQLVRLFEGGKEVRMSKRSGLYITMDELIDEVGLAAARFFFLTKSPGSHLNFDLDLAKKQSEKNPVYYVQYAHARICSLLKKAGRRKPSGKRELLNHSSELSLIKQLIRLPEIVEDTAEDYQVQRLPQYALDLAVSFHRFYQDCRIISEDKELTEARLSLVSASRIVLKNTFDLMGIAAPEKM
jgi:arginyl-tRNA synthetase